MLRNQRFLSKLRHTPHFVEYESLVPSLQTAASCPYPEPDQSSPRTQLIWISILISSLLHLHFPSCLFSSHLTTVTLYTPLPSTVPVIYHAHPILLYLSSRIIFCSGVQSVALLIIQSHPLPVTLSFLSPNIFLSKVAQIVRKKARKINILFLISSFRRVLHVVCFLLGNYPASGFYIYKKIVSSVSIQLW